MSKEELEKEARKDVDILKCIDLVSSTIIAIDKYGAYKLGRYDGYLAGAEPREKRIAELEAQIEKMKNCKNCANYMISGKCPSFFRTGWCKNWEMAKGGEK